MSDGNGDLEKKEKTPEELKAERLKRYQDDPESFVELSELICAAKRSPQGMAVLVNPSKRSELLLAKAELDHQLEQSVTAIEIQAFKDKQVIPAGKHSILNFAKKRFK